MKTGKLVAMCFCFAASAAAAIECDELTLDVGDAATELRCLDEALAALRAEAQKAHEEADTRLLEGIFKLTDRVSVRVQGRLLINEAKRRGLKVPEPK